MPKNYIFYNNDGKITASIFCKVVEIEYYRQYGEFIEGSCDIFINYINGNVIELRPTQETTLSKGNLRSDGIDSITILNAPKGIFTAINMLTNDAITGTIEGTDTFSTTITGTYKITIESFPYLPFETTITAV